MKAPWLCSECKKRKNCKEPCRPVELYCSNSECRLKELLINSQVYEIYDYKDILSSPDPKPYHINCIRSVENTVVRAVLSMLYAKISITDIATLLNIDRGSIYWQVRNHTHDTPDMFPKLNRKLKKSGVKTL